MNSITSTCLIIVLSMLAHQIHADLISEACDITRFKEVCLKTFRDDPSSAGADIHGLVKIALKAAAKTSSRIQSKIPDLLAKTEDRFTRQALQDCIENYEGASEQISDSLVAAESHRYFDVNTWVTAAMSDADSCEDGFKEGTSLLTKDNDHFSQLSSNVLAISNKASDRF